MTLPASGPLSLNQINTEFNRGTNLGAYRGVQWWKDNTATGFFTSTNLGVNQFYEKRFNSPVTPGSAYYQNSGNYQSPFNSSGQFTVPLYSTLTITSRGGGGGGAGGSSNNGAGGAGNAGGTTTFGTGGYQVTAPGGSGGASGGNGATAAAGAGSDGTPAGGAGGAAGYAGTPAGGNGGAGGKTVTVFTNPISGGSGPTVGVVVSTSIGNGGSGGGGGGGVVYTGWPPFYYAPSPGGNGSAGGQGYVEVSWL